MQSNCLSLEYLYVDIETMCPGFAVKKDGLNYISIIFYCQSLIKRAFPIFTHKGATKKGPNMEQNLENEEQNVGKKLQNWAFLGCCHS